MSNPGPVNTNSENALAALCRQPEGEITSNRVELLNPHCPPRGRTVREEDGRRTPALCQEGHRKGRILYKPAKGGEEQPERTVEDVIHPAVGEKTLEELIQEAEMADQHKRQVKIVTRASYSHHYRRILPALLAVLFFQSNKSAGLRLQPAHLQTGSD